VDKRCIKFHEFILSLEPQNISEIGKYDQKKNEINMLNYDLWKKKKLLIMYDQSIKYVVLFSFV